MSQQQKKYDGPPSTFVNVKRVKTGQDSKGRDTITICFGEVKGREEGSTENSLDTLIDALTELRGKQANLVVHMEEKESSDGRSFLSAFARVTEMIPRAAGGGGKTQFVPKNRASAAAERTAAINKKFNG